MLPVWEANDDCCSLLASFAASLPAAATSVGLPRWIWPATCSQRSEGTIGELAHC